MSLKNKTINRQKKMPFDKKKLSQVVLKVREERTTRVRYSVQGKGWSVTKGIDSEPLRVFSTAVDAIKFATEIAQKENTEIEIYTKLGKIRRSSRLGTFNLHA